MFLLKIGNHHKTCRLKKLEIETDLLTNLTMYGFKDLQEHVDRPLNGMFSCLKRDKSK